MIQSSSTLLQINTTQDLHTIIFPWHINNKAYKDKNMKYLTKKLHVFQNKVKGSTNYT